MIITNTAAFRAAKPVLVVLAIAASACIAKGQPLGFVEGFDGPDLDPAWNQNGDPIGHPATIAGTYDITDAHGQPGTTLNRATGGTVSSFTHEIDLVLDPHLLSGSGGTRSDLKFRSIGANGILDVVYNSFGHLRVDHNDFMGNSDHIAGASPNNITIGYTDGDALNLKVEYDNAADTIDVSYSLNGGSAVSVYSGGGIVGPLGDVITGSVEVLVFKFGDAVPDQTLVAIDNWSLAETISSTPGDFDSDEDVDGQDFLIWQHGDAPQGGTTDELAEWQTNYPGAPGQLVAASAAVPEPSGILLVVTSAAITNLRRRIR